MGLTTILLVFFMLDGEGYTFAVATKGPAECIVTESKVGDILPTMLGRKPQFYAAKCADVKPFLTAL